MVNSTSKVLAFIGDGEGKTSAALGHAIRAAGHDKRVAVIQFLKGRDSVGEFKYLIKRSGIEIYLVGSSSFVLDKKPSKEHIQKAADGFVLAKKLISERKYFLIILDEAFDAISTGLISTNDILGLIKHAKGSDAPPHLIFTGRVLPTDLSTKIDLITQMRKIKHYFDSGEKGIEGLDW
jgi:cob(I)alamin adenosyltransferase